jgi:hypothetical protein
LASSGAAAQFTIATFSTSTSITLHRTSGVDVGPVSAARSEAEILFRGGTEFEVLNRRLGGP